MITKNLPYYITSVALFVLFKFGYTLTDNVDLLFLLKPTAGSIELITNINAQFFVDTGFYFEALNITIDKSCSGFNFWILCFVMLVFLVVKFLKTTKQKVLSLPILLVATLGFTVFVNTSRILLAIFIQQTNLIDTEISWLHQAEGAFVYLFFLIAIYLGVEFLFHRSLQTTPHQ